MPFTRRSLLYLTLASSLWAAGPGKGKHVVLIAGDEEYRSEEALPQLAKILTRHHGFKCTVLFAIDKNDGTVNPKQVDNIPGLEALDHADLMIMFIRWRDLPDDQMKHIVDYAEAGKPILALRTATHPFNLKTSQTYARYNWNNKEWSGGFGRQILGETWVNHHGQHGKQSTRGIFAKGQENHPILKGIKDGEIWGPTDVYEAHPYGDSVTLLYGQVLTGMNQNDPPVEGKQNDPMMPIAWTKTYKGGRIFTTTMGSSQDLLNEGVRRMIVNATYWTLGLEKKIDPKSNVAIVGDYQPLPFKFGGHKPGMKPADLLK